MAMPDFNGNTLLVTGLNGFVGAVLGKHVLSKGYKLRGTVRRLESVENIIKGPLAIYKARVEIIQIPNMTAPGAFDEVVTGREEHTRSLSIKHTNMRNFRRGWNLSCRYAG